MPTTEHPIAQLDESQRESLETNGFFIARGVLDSEDCSAIRTAVRERAEQVIANSAFNDDLLLEKDADPSLPAEERLRKLNRLYNTQGFWEHYCANPKLLAYARAILGDSILVKYAGCFLKPAHFGGDTPWHQDIALWQDRNAGALSCWTAIDPATRENGCLQFIPGTHREGLIEHVRYPDSLHDELPRELLENRQEVHVELEPGDAVFWHSYLWHYSPPNRSDHSRLGCASVWINPSMIPDVKWNRLKWAMWNGQALPFPGPELIVDEDNQTLGLHDPKQAGGLY